MSSIVRFFVVCAVLPFLFCPAFAQSDSGRGVWAGDARLHQSVRVQAEGVSVGELCARLKVVLNADLWADRVITDEKVIVLGPHRPACDVLDDVAHLLNAVWERDPTARADAPPRYLLRYAPGTRKYEIKLCEQAALLRVRVLVDNAPKTADAPWRGLWAEQAAKPENKAVCALLARLPPAQQITVMNGEPVFVPIAALTASEKEAANILAGRAQNMADEMAADDIAHGDTPPAPVPFEEAGVWLEGSQDRIKTMVSLRQGNLDEWFGTVANQEGFVLPPHGFPYAGGNVLPPADLPPAPAINSIVEKYDDLPGCLVALAKATERPIVADFYRTAPIAAWIDTAPEKTPPAVPTDPVSALDELCRRPGYLWWTSAGHGKTLFFRKRDWYEQKACEVPDRWYDALAARLVTQKGIPTYGDVARLSSELSEAQISGLMLGPTHPKPKSDAEARYETSRFWSRENGKSVRNLLLVLRAAPVQAKALVPDLLTMTPAQRKTSWITTARSTPAQKAAWANFVQEKRSFDRPASGDSRFAFSIVRATPFPPPKNALPSETVGLEFRYQVGSDKRIYFLTFPLPLHAPNDKRDQMRVALVP